MTSPKMASKTSSFFKSRRFFLGLQFVSMSLLYLPNGLGWYFGNMVVYLNSYTYAELDTSRFLSQWVMSVYMISRSCTIILVGNIVRKMDRRVFTFIGIFLYDVALFLSYFTVQVSQVAYIITYGAMAGIGYGFIQTEVLTRLPTLLSKRVGLALAFVNNFMSIGAMFYDWMITWYANNRNKEADVTVAGHYMVFSDKSVIDHVPGLFILLGIITSMCHLSAFILSAFLKDKGAPEKSTNVNSGIEIDLPAEAVESTSLTQGLSRTGNTPDSISNGGFLSEESELKQETVRHTDVAIDLEKSDKQNETHANLDFEMPARGTTIDSTSTDGDLNQLQILKTKPFYILWFGMFANDASYIFLLNFYKVFGELWIRDDHYLTHIGMASLFTVIVGRMLWALAMDKFGVKNTQIILSASMCLAFAFYFFAPQIDQWLFAVMTCAMTGLCSAVYIVFPIMTLKLFGQTHFAANYGMVITSTLVLNIIAPIVATTLVDDFGWAALFLGTSALNALSVIAVVFGLPNVQGLV